MPFGVSQDFLNLLDDGKRRGLVALIPLAGLAVLGGVVAELLDPGRLGAFVTLYGASLAAGILFGALAGWRVVRSWGQSLREGWTEWMHSAMGAGSVAEAAERAGATRLTAWRAAGAILLAANAACLIAAWFQLPPLAVRDVYGLFAIATVSLTALSIGVRAAMGVAEAWWCKEIEEQTLELVQEGRVGVWGVR